MATDTQSISKKNIATEYTTTKKEHHGTLFRLSNYFILLSMRAIDSFMHGAFPDLAYALVVGAVVGYDFFNIYNTLTKKRD